MEPWLPLFIFGLLMGALLIFIARYQARRYHTYLERHNAETAKLVASQAQTLAAMERQTAALERIATTLEQRS